AGGSAPALGDATAAAIPAAATAAATPATAAARRAVWRTVRELDPRRDDRERIRAADRLTGWQFQELRRLARDRLVEQRAIATPGNFGRAEAAQMLGHVLG